MDTRTLDEQGLLWDPNAPPMTQVLQLQHRYATERLRRRALATHLDLVAVALGLPEAFRPQGSADPNDGEYDDEVLVANLREIGRQLGAYRLDELRKSADADV